MSLTDEFKENEHPRGQPGNPGQFAPSAGGGSSSEQGENKQIKGTGRGALPQPDFRGSLARQTSGSTTQPVKSVDELYERARKEEKPFRDTLESMAEKYNSAVMYTPEAYAEPGTILKSRSSAERKLKSELGNDPKLLRDVLRATIVSGDVEDTRKAAADFIGEHAEDILRVKDRYVDQIGGGYRDILINYRTPGGLVAEIQFNSRNMVRVKMGEAHSIYEKIRELTNPTMETVKALEKQMSDIYESAYLADGDSKWKTAKDSVGPTPARQFKLTSPNDKTFEAAIVEVTGGQLLVMSNRTGSWHPDAELKLADLIMPEQSLLEEGWEVTPMPPEPLSSASDDKYQTGAAIDPQDGFQRRALDRRSRDAQDIEYYTAETLGPNRERTPEGFLICFDVPAARIGEMVYAPMEVPPELGRGSDGRVRVTRSEAEVFDPRSMASLNGKPVTDDHPPVDVDPRNWKFYTKGTVVNPRRGEGDLKDFLVVDIIVYDENTIQDIEAGKRQVSCGYNPEYLQLLDAKTGDVIPGRGEQVKIRYNHLALVSAGRCGPYCAIGDRKTVDHIGASPLWTPERERRLARLSRRI